ITIFNFPNQQGRIWIMQLLIPFDQLHVTVGVTIIACHQVYNNLSILSYNFSNNAQVVTFVSLFGSGCGCDYSTCSRFVFSPAPIIDENI
ncbi:MAG: hypothetical protein UHW99_01290, partial [Methanobrevibacter sp.]|nr:hypothetical protein [Methanobrevibacter sp.]